MVLSSKDMDEKEPEGVFPININKDVNQDQEGPFDTSDVRSKLGALDLGQVKKRDLLFKKETLTDAEKRKVLEKLRKRRKRVPQK